MGSRKGAEGTARVCVHREAVVAAGTRKMRHGVILRARKGVGYSGAWFRVLLLASCASAYRYLPTVSPWWTSGQQRLMRTSPSSFALSVAGRSAQGYSTRRWAETSERAHAGASGGGDSDLSAREKVAAAIPKPKKETGTDPKKMLLPAYSMFPPPPAGTGEDLEFDETIHSGGLALLKLYHESRRPVVAHYWYKSCAMCKLMKPVIQRIVRENDGEIHYVDVEISINKKTMNHAGVRSIPAVQVFKNGKMVSHFSGLQTVAQMRQLFADAIAAGESNRRATATMELGSLLSGWRSTLRSDSATLSRDKALGHRLAASSSVAAFAAHDGLGYMNFNSSRSR